MYAVFKLKFLQTESSGLVFWFTSVHNSAFISSFRFFFGVACSRGDILPRLVELFVTTEKADERDGISGVDGTIQRDMESIFAYSIGVERAAENF